MAPSKNAKRAVRLPETVEEKKAFREKARACSFAELAEQDEMETLLFKSLVVAAEHMDEVEALRRSGKATWMSKISAIRVGYWKAVERWGNVAHPSLFAKPSAAGKAKKRDDDVDDEEEEEEPEYVPDMTIPADPVDWRDVLVWKENEDYPFIRDTTVHTENINSLFDEDWALELVMKCYPQLTMRDIIACQEFEKEDMPARKKYEAEYFDKQRMSPLHPNFEVAPFYPKTPIPPIAPADVAGQNEGPTTLPRRGSASPWILLGIAVVLAIIAAVRGGETFARVFGMAIDRDGRYARRRFGVSVGAEQGLKGGNAWIGTLYETTSSRSHAPGRISTMPRSLLCPSDRQTPCEPGPTIRNGTATSIGPTGSARRRRFESTPPDCSERTRRKSPS